LGLSNTITNYRELLLAERDEERRILADLSIQVAMHGHEILTAIDVIADLDLARKEQIC
jgi:dsDNA-specific endonuclease/ATPase MutS2